MEEAAHRPDRPTRRARHAVVLAVLATIVVVAVAGTWRLAGTGLVVDADRARPFGPEPPRPADVDNPYQWRRTVAADRRHAVYEHVVRRGGGALAFDDARAWFWDSATRELALMSDHVDPWVRSAVAVDGRGAVFVEQRDPGTSSDGVNPDGWRKRVVYWDGVARRAVPLSGFEYGTVADVALSGDASTAAFIGDRRTFVVATAGGAPPTDVTRGPVDARARTGYSGDGDLSLSDDGRIVAYGDVHRSGELALHDVVSGRTSFILDMIRSQERLATAAGPSLCGDGSRLAFTAAADEEPFSDRHQTEATAFVVETATGRIVARSRRGLRRGADTGYARSVVLSPDCRRFAYVAPGSYDGRDLDGNALFDDDLVVVTDVATGEAIRLVTSSRAPEAFLGRHADTLLLRDGSALRL